MFWLQDIYKQKWQFLVFLGWGVTGDLFHFSLTRDHLPAPRKQPGQRHPTRGNDGDVHTFSSSKAYKVAVHLARRLVRMEIGELFTDARGTEEQWRRFCRRGGKHK